MNNMYVNYYANEINAEGDKKPTRIVLCADKSEIVAEFALSGLKNQIFTSKYIYYIPKNEQLIKKFEDALGSIINEKYEK